MRGVSHVVAFAVSLAAAAVVMALAPPGGAAVAFAVYGAGLVVLFGGSGLYHRWPRQSRFKPVLQRIDHSGIFVFIAACYTPIAVVVLHGPLAWVVLGVAWVGAAGGVALSLGWIDAPRPVTAGAYLALGWVAVIAAPQLAARLAVLPLALIVAGGILYSLGAMVYVRQRPDPWPRTFGFHEIFHVLVILAAASYYAVVIGWMLPAAGSSA